MFLSIRGKVVYLIGTGSIDVLDQEDLISSLEEQYEHVFPLLTDSAKEILKAHGKSDNLERKGGSYGGHSLPLEDITIVAPATFNTVNKIANGIADTYEMTLIASSIGKAQYSNNKVVIAPSMNKELFYHPVFKRNLKIISTFKNVSIVQPGDNYLMPERDALVKKMVEECLR